MGIESELLEDVPRRLEQLSKSVREEWRDALALQLSELKGTFLKWPFFSLRSISLSQVASTEKGGLTLSTDVGAKGVQSAGGHFSHRINEVALQVSGQYNKRAPGSDRSDLFYTKYSTPVLDARSDPLVGSAVEIPDIFTFRSGLESKLGRASEVRADLSAVLTGSSTTAPAQERKENLQVSLSTEIKGRPGTLSPFSVQNNLSFEERSSEKMKGDEVHEQLYRWNLRGRWGVIEDIGLDVDTVQTTKLQSEGDGEVTFAPRANLALKVHENLKAGVSAYRGTHQVAAIQRFAPFLKRVNESFIPQNSNADQNMGGDLLLEYKNALYSISVVGFLAQLSDARTDVPTAVTEKTSSSENDSGKVNSETFSIGGSESTLSYPLSESLVLGVTHLWNRAERQGEGGDTFTIPFLPTHTLAMHLNYSSDTLSLQLLRQYVGSQFEDERNTLRVPSHGTLDITMRRNITNSSNLYLSARNLLNEGQNEEERGSTIGVGSPLLVLAGITLRF